MICRYRLKPILPNACVCFIAKTMLQEDKLLAEIKQILLEEEIQEQEVVKKELESLKSELQTGHFEEKRLNPYFEQKVNYLQQNFPQLFGSFVAAAVKVQLRESQDEVVEALYPIMGRLVRKFIASELQAIAESIDKRVNEVLSPDAWWQRFVDFFNGKKTEVEVVKHISRPKIEEIFLIDLNSGLLLGHYSYNNLIDPDIIAGMLTGIKTFVEHAFMQGPQELQSLEYDKYKLLVNSLHTVYIAFVVEGNVTPAYKGELFEASLDFAQKYKISAHQDVTQELLAENSAHLEAFFKGFHT